MKILEVLFHNLRAHIDIFIWFIPLACLFFVLFLVLQTRSFKIQTKETVGERMPTVLLSLSCAFITVMTLVGRPMGEPNFQWNPLESYITILKTGDAELLLQCVFNIAMYIPIGILLPRCFALFKQKKRVILVASIVAVLIEFIQGALGMGLFEVDDIINNVLGALIGVVAKDRVMKD